MIGIKYTYLPNDKQIAILKKVLQTASYGCCQNYCQYCSSKGDGVAVLIQREITLYLLEIAICYSTELGSGDSVCSGKYT